MTDGYTEVRFSGGPLYWRKRRRGTTMQLRDDIQRLEIVGVVRPIRYVFRAEKGAVTYRTGVYQRVAPDRFRWIGWADSP